MIDVSIALQAAATVSTLLCAYFMAEKRLSAPVWGVISNVAWLSLEIYLQLWLLIPVPVVMTVLHLRVYRRWSAG
jgi:hypothetical protein